MGVSPGVRLRNAMIEEHPLQMVGVTHPLVAKQAEATGFKALYLSGAGVANVSLGIPDLGLLSLGDVATDARRVCAATDLPVVVDIDTGLGPAIAIPRTVVQLATAGAAGVQIEDQAIGKRCGHRTGKRLVAPEVMAQRIRLVATARTDPGFVIVARTDSLAGEGLPGAIERSRRYEEAGADILFLEAATDPVQYSAVAEAISIPILANMTEFGMTPLVDIATLAAAGVGVVLYPLTISRAMHLAARDTLRTLRTLKTQVPILDRLMPRSEVDALLDYAAAQRLADQLSDDQ